MTVSLAGGLSPGRWKTRLNAVLTAPIGYGPVELLAIVLLIPVLLHAALWNGFPLLFFDSGAYMLEGFGMVFVPERSPVYSLFLRYVLGRQSLWFVSVAQCLIIAFVMVQLARSLRPRTSLRAMLGLGVFISVFSGIAWIAGQVEPDCLTPIVVLTIYLVGFRRRQMGWWRSALTVLIGAFAIGAHPSHLGLAAGLTLVIIGFVVTALLLRHRLRLPRANPILPALTVFAAIAMTMTANYVLTQKVFLNRSGTIFFAARLIGDGTAKKTLSAVCPTHKLKLCPYKDYLPKTADSYLWGPYTPFNKIGRFYGPRQEYDFLVRESVKRYPLEILGSGLWASVRQFFMIRTGDGISPTEWVLNDGFAHFMPNQAMAYMEAKQQQGKIWFTGVNVVHVPLLFGAEIWLVFVLIRALRRRQWGRAVLPAYLFVALLGNALVCGMFSGPHDRYQSRLVWIAPFMLVLTERSHLTAAWRARLAYAVGVRRRG